MSQLCVRCSNAVVVASRYLVHCPCCGLYDTIQEKTHAPTTPVR